MEQQPKHKTKQKDLRMDINLIPSPPKCGRLQNFLFICQLPTICLSSSCRFLFHSHIKQVVIPESINTFILFIIGILYSLKSQSGKRTARKRQPKIIAKMVFTLIYLIGRLRFSKFPGRVVFK